MPEALQPRICRVCGVLSGSTKRMGIGRKGRRSRREKSTSALARIQERSRIVFEQAKTKDMFFFDT